MFKNNTKRHPAKSGGKWWKYKPGMGDSIICAVLFYYLVVFLTMFIDSLSWFIELPIYIRVPGTLVIGFGLFWLIYVMFGVAKIYKKDKAQPDNAADR